MRAYMQSNAKWGKYNGKDLIVKHVSKNLFRRRSDDVKDLDNMQ